MIEKKLAIGFWIAVGIAGVIFSLAVCEGCI